MKVYNKETRNEDGKFYRNGDWGIEVDDSFFDTHPRADNFTAEVPPVDIKVDWVDGQGWVEDTNLTDEGVQEKRRKRYEEELTIADQIDEIWKSIEAGSLTTKAQEIINKRKAIKSELPYLK